MTDAEAPPALEFVFAAQVTVDRPLDLGDVGKGGRRIVPITGGEFSGPRLRARSYRAALIGRSFAARAWPSSKRATHWRPTTAR
jgi:hypothetical protein